MDVADPGWLGVGLSDAGGDEVGGSEDGGGEDEGGGEDDGGADVGGDETGGGTDRVDEPCSRTCAPPGSNEMTADQRPEGSIDRSTRTLRVIDSPGRSTPLRADSSSQYADVDADHVTGAPPLAVSVMTVRPGAGRAATTR